MKSEHHTQQELMQQYTEDELKDAVNKLRRLGYEVTSSRHGVWILHYPMKGVYRAFDSRYDAIITGLIHHEENKDD